MIIDHLANLLALRAALVAVPPVAKVQNTVLGTDEMGYTRSSGSFVTDGFSRGMEIVPAGFADNTPRIVSAVTDTHLTIDGGVGVEAAVAGRSLVSGVSPLVVYDGDNSSFTPPAMRCWIEEDYLPGPARMGSTGTVVGEPMYVLRLYSPAGYGVAGPYKLADALLAQFAPMHRVATINGYGLWVRGNPAPYRGQLTTRSPGRALVVVTIPLQARAVNT